MLLLVFLLVSFFNFNAILTICYWLPRQYVSKFLCCMSRTDDACMNRKIGDWTPCLSYEDNFLMPHFPFVLSFFLSFFLINSFFSISLHFSQHIFYFFLCLWFHNSFTNLLFLFLHSFFYLGIKFLPLSFFFYYCVFFFFLYFISHFFHWIIILSFFLFNVTLFSFSFGYLFMISFTQFILLFLLLFSLLFLLQTRLFFFLLVFL